MANETKADPPGDALPVVHDGSAAAGPAPRKRRAPAARKGGRPVVHARRKGDPMATDAGNSAGPSAIAGAFAAIGAGIREAFGTLRQAMGGTAGHVAPVACKVCGRKLTGAKSRAAGMGKRCTVKLHAAEQSTFQPMKGTDDGPPA